QLTTYPSILGGRVKILHPAVFGGILGRRDLESDKKEMEQYNIPPIDLVIIDLYPFEETLKSTSEEAAIIEKIDIGGPSAIRAAAKNFKEEVVLASRDEYAWLLDVLKQQDGITSLEERKAFAAKAFEVVMNYDIAINNYFNGTILRPLTYKQSLRYGENPDQKAAFYGDLTEEFTQLNGKELSYNNLVDVDAAIALLKEFKQETEVLFGIIKHTNVCGVALRPTVSEAYEAANAGDPESAFGGILIASASVDKTTAEKISEVFFEVLIAPAFDDDALEVLKKKKTRILLQLNPAAKSNEMQFKSVLNGVLVQEMDQGNFAAWKEVGGRETSEEEKSDLAFANIICKHLKSNAIALVKNKQLIGKGCGQTSRIDALRHAIEKANQFNFDLKGSVLASDAFFPFNDCVSIAHKEGIEAFIQPGGSIRDKDSIDYTVENKLAMVITDKRHFRHG
ncbi:MAG: bifunctional phosphoribosylaminoimidazolecarboxamide formyltransferase/IMP cyclohydrolase PurH, partial [Pseudopedobacter saltans]